MDTRGLNQWIELDRAAYSANIALFRALIGPERELCAVVKANAYGHGALEVAQMARGCGVDSFAVHSLEEAIELREAGVTEPVLLLGSTPRRRLGEVVAQGLRTVVYDLETLRELDRLGRASSRPVPVHVKVETGTGRQGLEGAALFELLEELKGLEGCRAEGIYTHFANIEDTTRHDYARAQAGAFDEVLDEARRRGLRFPLVHSACSAAALLFPETYGDLVRIGIAQYGLWPSRETYLSYRLAHPDEPDNGPRPVLRWKCRVSQVKEMPADRHVGYGCSYLTTRPTRLAVLPVGYSDGYPRSLSNLGYVLIRNRRAQIRGRVCMNLTMVDVTDIPEVQVEDEVELVGAGLEASDLAALAGTIGYELVARLRPGIPRFIVG